ncbi:hypothetical protein P175DRAFT_0488919 [Aspergillus ochraceoroseus IBT 24754]|uniref:Uncharacterized protein n=1 Tax=Aspergillus ochraceoroseus IBT 24754 TaxID=1392256 RepID=A0A2T5M5E5_9EURO|nr:uncharacterized protein P175DRAFT_0488919 [Aspergillus ochraceoroseus IBT 24754]PTU23716.1 hypothetical protein P175DRAFT_0488919 [Aspergillus ochraceoroseus IBT 24754]
MTIRSVSPYDCVVLDGGTVVTAADVARAGDVVSRCAGGTTTIIAFAPQDKTEPALLKALDGSRRESPQRHDGVTTMIHAENGDMLSGMTDQLERRKSARTKVPRDRLARLCGDLSAVSVLDGPRGDLAWAAERDIYDPAVNSARTSPPWDPEKF